MSRNWFVIENKANTDTAKLYLYDEVGGYGIDAKDFINELNDVTAKTIDVHINSIGGEVYQGFAIYQALKQHPATVNITIDAIAASIASVIAMAGDKVSIAKTGEMMIHDGMVSMSMCNAAELTKMVSMLERVSTNIASVYADRAGGNPDMWRNAMKEETWFSAQEALSAGLVDEVVSTKSAVRNVADMKLFNYAGRSFAPEPSEVLATKKETIQNADTPTEPYGPVEYADPGYQADGQKRYPMDTADHVRAAWSYINQEDNAKLYTSEQLDNIKQRIMTAAKKFNIEIAPQNSASIVVTNEIPFNLQLINALKEVFHA
jgi:ATP-dependent protease ClpP protease subunit